MNIKAMITLSAFALSAAAWAQPATYIDELGVMRWSESKKEVCVFGTNYSIPFAYWEAREPIGADHKKAIDEDVYHIARLGLDGYRIHVWPSYISDADGNLVYNQHFQLFDYLLFKLKERGIKLFITPMYLAGGHGSFIEKFGGKTACLSNPAAFPAQANYLAQFVAHVNPYTGLAYMDDPDVLGFEIVNEPQHYKAPEQVTPYINQMIAAIRGAGCENPLFYNMTTAAAHIDRILPTQVQGGTFQWYPTGLTSNHDQKSNLLPNVDQYEIPFADQLSAMPKFVYEFSPADVVQSGPLYPAMARSFREAGFQFAAQFAYDPMHAAYCNVEYRTHFLNLAYSPKKAIGLMIANEAFHAIPRGKSYGRYPTNNSFDAFHLSYEDDLAEMVTDEQFLYSNQTDTHPPKPSALKQIAGTSSSPVVQYDGTGAYFIDQLEDGVWRLEVLPDAAWVSDPFFVTSLTREVAVVLSHARTMTVSLPNLGPAFSVVGLNDGNEYKSQAARGTFTVSPGSYLLTRDGTSPDWDREDYWKNIQLKEFHTPARELQKTYVRHTPAVEVSAGAMLNVSAKIITPQDPEQVELIVVGIGGGQRFPMAQTGAFDYFAHIPAELTAEPGLLRYHISLKNGDSFTTYPSKMSGAHVLNQRIYGDDRQIDEGGCYQTRIVTSLQPICLFDADRDWLKLTKMKRKDRIDCVPSAVPGKTLIQVKATKLEEDEHDFSIRNFCADRIAERAEDLDKKHELVLYGHALNNRVCPLQLALVMKDGSTYGGVVRLDPIAGSYSLPLKSLKRVKSVLLPRAYPSFLPYWFESATKSDLDLSKVESLQISFGPGMTPNQYGDKNGVAIGWIALH